MRNDTTIISGKKSQTSFGVLGNSWSFHTPNTVVSTEQFCTRVNKFIRDSGAFYGLIGKGGLRWGNRAGNSLGRGGFKLFAETAHATAVDGSSSDGHG